MENGGLGFPGELATPHMVEFRECRISLVSSKFNGSFLGIWDPRYLEESIIGTGSPFAKEIAF